MSHLLNLLFRLYFYCVVLPFSVSDREVSLEALNTRLEFMNGMRNSRPKQVIRINDARLRATEKF